MKAFYVVYDTTISRTTSVLKVFLCTTCNRCISFQVCCLPHPRGFCSVTTSSCQDQNEKTWSRPDCYMPRLQHPCKPKLLRQFCSLCSSHNVNLRIYLSFTFISLFFLSVPYLSRARLNIKRSCKFKGFIQSATMIAKQRVSAEE